MSSCPFTHSVEGRDWAKLFQAFSINRQVAHRPNFASYNEVLGQHRTYSVMSLAVQKDLRPDTCEVAAENPGRLAFSNHQQRILHNIVRFLYRGKVPFPLVFGGPYLLPMYFRNQGRSRLVILNGSPDPACPVIDFGPARTVSSTATLLAPLAKSVTLKRTTGKTAVPYLGFLVLDI